MKKLLLLSIFVFAFACKGKKEEINNTEKKAVKQFKYDLSTAATKVNFTAYKTSAKTPVKGTFKTIKVTKNGKAATIKEALNNAEVEIPINSIKTNETSRDYKIMKFFFEKMTNTVTLMGKLTLGENNVGQVDFTMNEITKVLPITYTIEGNVFNMKATMDINTWNAQSALASLNTICKDLHKGTDGISKTWNDVAIDITSEF